MVINSLESWNSKMELETYISVFGFQGKKIELWKNKLCINFVCNIKMPALIEIDDKIKIILNSVSLQPLIDMIIHPK